MKVAYFSTLPKNSRTGGSDAVNYNTYRELRKYYNCEYFHIDEPIDAIERLGSRIKRRLLRQKGAFYCFSEKRLNRIAERVDKALRGYDIAFFRGFTPWINSRIDMPYFAYNDVNFRTFFENTFSYSDFEKRQIESLFEREAMFLSAAKGVFFESDWGMNVCRTQYALSGNALMGIGRAGEGGIPERDTYAGGYDLVLIAKRFSQKGGDVAFEAFKKIYEDNQGSRFNIIGGHPGIDVIKHSGVEYHGYLRREHPEDLRKIKRILSSAFLLVHLSKEDTNPLVITEAGYWGCPAISVNKFAIPELVVDGETGILLEPDEVTPENVYIKIKNLLLDKEKYNEMRNKTREFNMRFSWEQIGQEIRDNINKALR
ncbi:MAG: glycosyltransferase [Candidatus Omnitrophica bacterium]|nr:glycosyltransferase [Candidatus Omnitrophota bacterium]